MIVREIKKALFSVSTPNKTFLIMSLFIFIHHYAPLLCGENPYLLLLAAFYFINKIYLENFKRRKCFFSNEGESAFASALISHLKSFPLGILA